MRVRETPESGNAFCDWLDCAARLSFVSFFIIFDFYFCRKISSHSLVGLENGAMLLLGGKDWGNGGASQTGIWELKEEEWNRIDEFSKV